MPAASLGLPSKLGHYSITRKIGEGGMGAVYRAQDEHLDRDVAIKVLAPGVIADEHTRTRFRHEALTLSRLSHPNIETIFDFDSSNGLDFIVTEYIPGEGLDQRLTSGAVPEKDIARLGAQLAEGLAAAHNEGIIHCDLKPSNLRITPDGRLKILDFGLAKLAMPGSPDAPTARLSESARFSGTLPYMAPEQVRGEKLDVRADIWGAGAVLYEMATGKPPFRAPGLNVTDQILHETPAVASSLNPQLSPALDITILKCLDKDPENRYQSAWELAVDLRRLAMPSTVMQTTAPRLRFPRRVLALTASIAFSVVALLLGFNVGGMRTRLRSQPPVTRIQSLAVLPLANLSRDPDQEYFVQGMTEALITDLSKISALKVISRTSVMRYKDSNKPLPEIARELNVDGVIEGSVLRVGDRVRVTAQLIHAPSDVHIWAESYERDLRDVLSLQEEVATAIAGQVQIAITAAERQRLANARGVNPEAYVAYLQGRYFFLQGGGRKEEDLEKAIAYYQQALQLDPGYAAGWAALAAARSSQADFGILPVEAGYAMAREATHRALTLDPGLAEAHAAMGHIKLGYDWDWANADADYAEARALQPGNTETLDGSAKLASTLGRFDEAIALYHRALELDPLNLSIRYYQAFAMYSAGQQEEAIAAFQKLLEMKPDFHSAHYALGRVYLAQSRPQEALTEMDRETYPAFRVVGLALAYHALAQKDKSDRALADFVAKYHASGAYQIAEIYAYRGQNDPAFKWLELAYAQRDGGLIWMKSDPLLSNLKTDPRYAAFLTKMRLPQ